MKKILILLTTSILLSMHASEDGVSASGAETVETVVNTKDERVCLTKESIAAYMFEEQEKDDGKSSTSEGKTGLQPRFVSNGNQMGSIEMDKEDLAMMDGFESGQETETGMTLASRPSSPVEGGQGSSSAVV